MTVSFSFFLQTVTNEEQAIGGNRPEGEQSTALNRDSLTTVCTMTFLDRTERDADSITDDDRNDRFGNNAYGEEAVTVPNIEEGLLIPVMSEEEDDEKEIIDDTDESRDDTTADRMAGTVVHVRGQRQRSRLLLLFLMLGLVVAGIVASLTIRNDPKRVPSDGFQGTPETALVTPSPVTVVPTTDSPVTVAPTTASPLTLAPATLAPVTLAPVTPAPVTASPVTASPVTASPVTASPVTSSPVTASPTEPPSPEDVIVNLLAGLQYNTNEGYQQKALRWVANQTSHLVEATTLQLYALASIWYSTNTVRTPYTDAVYGVGNTTFPGWIQSDGWLTNDGGTSGAGSNVTGCSWFGVMCNENDEVEGMILAYNGLTGSIPPEIALLKDSLKILILGGNIVHNGYSGLDWIGELTGLSECWYCITTVSSIS